MRDKKFTSWDDYLFENRHKSYGAYQLRTGEGKNLLKSLLITLSFCGVLILIWSFTINREEIKPDDLSKGHIVTILPDDVVEPPRIKPVVPSSEKPLPPETTTEKVDSDIIPDPTDNPPVESPFNKQDKIGKIEGDEDSGNHSNVTPPVNNTEGTGTGISEGADSDEGASQPSDERIYTPRDVSAFAVYPGCEKFAQNKEKLIGCMSRELQNELSIQMQDFETIARRYRIDQAAVKLQFVVDKSGKIVDVKPQSTTNKEFSKEAKEALERIAKRLVQKGKYLKPAELDDGSQVNMSFVIPVQFKSE